MSETLAPCPFCGGEAEQPQYVENIDSWVIVCKGPCNAEMDSEVSESAAAWLWNRRAESADHATLTKRVAELEETLAFAAQYKGIEARACPLCRYENGVFIDRCQMHTDMDTLKKRVQELETQLEFVTAQAGRLHMILTDYDATRGTCSAAWCEIDNEIERMNEQEANNHE